QGLADTLGEARTILPATFARAMERSDEYARTALGSPKEGTILTVIRDVAREITDQQTIHGDDFVPILEGGLATAHRSLEATKNGLEQMRKANVVDAGAKGFVLMLEGIVRFLHSGSLSAVPDPFVQADAELEGMDDVYDAGDVEHRYCTECLLTGEDIDRRKLREALSALGSSLVLAGTKLKTKIHVHVDNPDEVFEIAGRYGTVTNQKADDMLQQAHAVREGMPRVAIVTDSGADLPDIAYDELGIHVIPLRVQFGDRSYLDKIGMSAEQFFDKLEAGEHHPQTSQPAPGDFRRTYEYLASHFDDVVSISLTAANSGTYQAAESAASRVSGPGRVSVINSRTVSVGQGLVAMYAAECVAAGYNGQQVIAATEEVMAKTMVLAVVPDLSYAVRGGRIKPFHQRIAEFLNVSMVLKLGNSDRVVPAGIVTRKNSSAKGLLGYVKRRIDPAKNYRVAIGYGKAADAARELEQVVRDGIPSIESMHVFEFGAALGAHAGPDTLVIAVQDYTKPRLAAPPDPTQSTDI
ncbi:MAG: DegV family protein, partial [Gammaproteobacteria bacterium]